MRRTGKTWNGRPIGSMCFAPCSNSRSVTHVGVIVLFRVNLGHARHVPGPVRDRKEKIRVHRSVKTRMEAEGLEGGKYKPNAKFEHLDFEWED